MSHTSSNLRRGSSAIFLAAILSIPAAPGAWARTVELPGVGSMEVPESWSVTSAPRGSDVVMPTGASRLRFAIGPSNDGEAMVGEMQAYLEAQGVTFTSQPSNKRTLDYSGVRYQTMEVHGQWQGKQTIVNWIITRVNDRPNRPGKFVLISLWSKTFPDFKRDMDAVSPVLDSLFESMSKQ